MRTIIDLTEDASPHMGLHEVSDPSSIHNDDNDVVCTFRETELRMTFSQFLGFVEAATEFVFRDLHETDINDPDRCPQREHHELRALLQLLMSGSAEGVRGVVVPEELRLAVRHSLAAKRIDPENWRTLQEALHEQDKEIEELKDELAAPKKRRARKAGAA